MGNDKWVTLLGSQLYMKPPKKWDRRGIWMCLPFSVIRERFSETINAWLELRVQECEDAFTKWPALIRGSSGGPVEPALSAAVEFLDATLPRNGKHLAPTDFRAIAQQLIDAIPTDIDVELRGELSGKIKSANALSLRDRIGKALDGLPKEICATYQLDEQLIKQAVGARNSLTHDGRRGISVPKAVMIEGRIRLLAIAYVLKRIGIPDDDIVKRVGMCLALQPPISAGSF
jgi:hypothetical protein